MCNFRKAFERAFVSPVEKVFERAMTPPGTGGLAAAIDNQTAAANAAADRALEVQKDALKRADVAAVPVADSESAKLAAEARMRRLLGGSGVRRGGKTFGEAPVGYRMLAGE